MRQLASDFPLERAPHCLVEAAMLSRRGARFAPVRSKHRRILMATKTEKAAPKAAKTTKAASESAPAKTAKPAAKATAAKPNALQQPLKPSAELGAIVGTSPLPRGEVVSKVWDYIKKHNLQNPENKREIVADDKLKKVFGKDKCSMFEMNKHLAAHLKA